MQSMHFYLTANHFQKSVLCLLIVVLAALGFVSACATQDPDQKNTSASQNQYTPDDTASSADSNTSTSPDTSPITHSGFVAHEWGTYTSVQDSTGASLDGLHHVDEYLPPFVHMRDIASPQSKASVHAQAERPPVLCHGR